MPLHVHVCPALNPTGAQIVTDLLTHYDDLHVTHCDNCANQATTADALVMVTGLWSADEVAEVARIRRQHPDPTLIVLTLCDERIFHEALRQSGADHVLMLDESVPQLTDTLRALPAYAL